MSSWWAGYQGITLRLSEEEFLTFCKKYEETHKELDLEEILEEGSLREQAFQPSEPDGEIFDIVDITPADCKGMFFIPYKREDGTDNQRKEEQEIETKDYRSEASYLIFAQKQMADITAFTEEGRYNSYEELLEEYQKELRSYLPEDFKWHTHIGTFSYACYA